MNKSPTIVDNLNRDLKQRERLGIDRYGAPVRAGDKYLYSWRLMAYEELLDALVYYLAHLEADCPEELAEWRSRQSEL